MTRISALTALTSADGGDTVPILDVSATTTKKITKTAFLSDVIDGTLLGDNTITQEKLKATVSFCARRTTDQTLTTGVGTKVQFATEDHDYGSDYDAVTNYVFTAPYDGSYHFDSMVQLDAVGTQCWCYLYKNGTTVIAQFIQFPNATSDDASATANVTVDLTAGDTVEVRALHNAGGNRELLGSNVGCNYFSGFLVGRK